MCSQLAKQKDMKWSVVYPLLVPHGSLASHHYLTASVFFQLLSSGAPRAQYTTHKVELQQKGCDITAMLFTN